MARGKISARELAKMNSSYNQDAWNARTNFSEIRKRFFSKPGTVSEEQLNAAADAYINALKKFKKDKKIKRLAIPTRAQLIRTPF